MQPIERVGVFALLFLVVTVVAVVLWDREPEPLVPATEVAAKETQAASRKSKSASERAEPKASRPSTSPGKSSTKLKPKKASTAPNLPVAPESRPLTPPPAARAKPAEDAREDPKSRGGSSAVPAVATRTEPARAAKFQAPTTSTPTRAANEVEPRATTTPARPSTAAPSTYVVKSGDILGSIALATLGSSKRWKEIADLNPAIDPVRLKVGTVLRLPGGAKSTAAPVAAPATAAAKAPEAGSGYTIRSGDSLWLIAQRTLGDGSRWSEIAALNPTLDAGKLVVGRKITLPKGASVQKDSTVAQAARPSTDRPKKGVVR